MKYFWLLVLSGWLWLGLRTSNSTKIVNHLPDLYVQIQAEGIRFPELVYGQAAHETGLFESKIFLENKNLWGLKVPYKRETLATGWHRGHAKFASYGDCIKEYKAWQLKYLRRYERKYGKVQTDEEYITFLVRQGFAEDPQYADHLRKRTRQVRRAISQRLTPRSGTKIN